MTGFALRSEIHVFFFVLSLPNNQSFQPRRNCAIAPGAWVVGGGCSEFGEDILIAVAEKDLAAIAKLGVARAKLVWRIAERAAGLATRMQRAIEAMAPECLGKQDQRWLMRVGGRWVVCSGEKD